MVVKGEFFVGTTKLSDSFKPWQNEEIKEDDRGIEDNGSCWDYGSNLLISNWIWGLLIHSTDQTNFRLDSMSYEFLTFVIKLGLITLCLVP